MTVFSFIFFRDTSGKNCELYARKTVSLLPRASPRCSRIIPADIIRTYINRLHVYTLWLLSRGSTVSLVVETFDFPVR